jgi:type I restriction enzyme M protein
MIAIRSNFFYTRTVPCELWHFDKGKPAERRDQMLMIDARNVYRKVTRKIYDFSPKQLTNLTAIVWLYRGQRDRFLALVKGYVARVAEEIARVPTVLDAFDITLTAAVDQFTIFVESLATVPEIQEHGQTQLISDALAELTNATTAYKADCNPFLKGIARFSARYAKSPPTTNNAQHEARHGFEPLAEAIKGLIKQVDLLYKLAGRVGQLANDLAAVEETVAEFYDRRPASRRLKQLDEARKRAVDQLRASAYVHRHIVWIQERFPDAEMQAVPGLCKVVSRAEIKAADWSLTPGRYVGVAPPEIDEDFDFEESLREIHSELAELNNEAAALAAKIQENFLGLGV